MGSTRRSFTDEYKRDAVALVTQGSGGRRGFHPPAPTDPGVTVSRHRALLTLTTKQW